VLGAGNGGGEGVVKVGGAKVQGGVSAGDGDGSLR
jgi:hypothetical protein